MGENITNYISDKTLVSRIYNKLSQLNDERAKQLK